MNRFVWAVVGALFIWLLILTVQVGNFQKEQRATTTQMLDIMVKFGQAIGIELRVVSPSDAQ